MTECVKHVLSMTEPNSEFIENCICRVCLLRMQSYIPLFRGYIHNILEETNILAKDWQHLCNTLPSVNIVYKDCNSFINMECKNKLQITNITK